ncbi:Tn3 family transposase [Streptomyces sp. NPDC007856]|uniref:Tn3 family transposase n=1 Tax=Streptomyces sp. NPDC007856 TaxID=3364781 RepID=UPI00367E5B50
MRRWSRRRPGLAQCRGGPTCAAMLEVSRAQKTIFVARYLRLRDLQREIEEGLNVMHSSNGANSVIAYGKGGEIASNRRDEWAYARSVEQVHAEVPLTGVRQDDDDQRAVVLPVSRDGGSGVEGGALDTSAGMPSGRFQEFLP